MVVEYKPDAGRRPSGAPSRPAPRQTQTLKVGDKKALKPTMIGTSGAFKTLVAQLDKSPNLNGPGVSADGASGATGRKEVAAARYSHPFQRAAARLLTLYVHGVAPDRMEELLLPSKPLTSRVEPVPAESRRTRTGNVLFRHKAGYAQGTQVYRESVARVLVDQQSHNNA